MDLNYDNKEMRKYMIDAMKYWVEECDSDGFRCDVAGMVPMDFWKEAHTELNKIKPVFMLAEADGPHRFLYTRLLIEKEKNQALWKDDRGGKMITVKSSSGEIFAFVRQKGKYKVYAVFKLSDKKVRTELDSRLIAGEYTDLISD